jgi:hypothetical protein
VFSKLARLFEWRSALVIVKPATLIAWHRAGFRIFRRWKSRSAGRRPISADLRLFWGEERIADELLLKLQVRVSPRTVRKYMGRAPRPHSSTDQRRSTFVRYQACGILTCDFFVSVTVRFRILYVFVALEIGSRRLLHFNVTEHPTSSGLCSSCEKRCREIRIASSCSMIGIRHSRRRWMRRSRAGASRYYERRSERLLPTLIAND